MGSASYPTQLVGLLIPDHRRITADSISTALGSTYDTASAEPGVPVAQQDTEAVLESSGSQTDGGQLRVRTAKPGYPGPGGAGYVWKGASDASDHWRGRDVPNLLTANEAVAYSDVVDYLHPHAVTLDDDTIVVVTESVTVSGRLIQVRLRNPTTGAWTSNSPYTGSVIGSTYLWPCLCKLPDGKLLLFHWVYDDGANEAQVRMHFSTDGGASWTVGGRYVLPAALPVGTADDEYEPKRLRAAYKDGQVLLLAWVYLYGTPNDHECLSQYASSDNGGSFSQVLAATDMLGVGHQDVTVAGGAFVVVALNTSGFALVARLGSAYEPLDDTSSSTNPFSSLGSPITKDAALQFAITGAFVFTAVSPTAAVCADEDGVLYLYLGYADVSETQAGIVHRSTDYGVTWTGMGEGPGADAIGYWHQSGDTSTRPLWWTVTAQRGRVVMLTNFTATPDTHDDSLIGLYLGGYATLTMPPLRQFAARDDKQVGWGRTWLPFDLFGDVGWTLSGTATCALTSFSELWTVTPINSGFAYIEPGGTIDEGIIAEFAVHHQSGSGSGRYRFRVADGVNAYELEVRITSTTIAMRDYVADVEIADATVATGAYLVRIAISGASASVWYRAWSTTEDREYTLIASTTNLTDEAAAAPTVNRITIGVVGAGVSDTLVSHHAFNFVVDQYTGQQQAEGQTNPDELFPRSYSSSPVYVDDGVRIAAIDGPTFEGDTWNIDARSDYTMSNVLPNVAPSPSKPWRSRTTTAGMILLWDLDSEAATPLSSDLGNGLYAVYAKGINFRDFDVVVHDGASISTLWSVDASISVEYAQQGNTVVPSSAAASSGPYLMRNELVGGWFQTSNGLLRKIIGNSEGYWGRATLAKSAVIYIEGNTGTEPTGNRTGRFWFPAVCSMFHLSSTRAYRGIGIRLRPGGASLAPSDGYYEIGTLALGPVTVWGVPPDFGRQHGREANVEVTTRPDRSKRSRVRGPALRTVQLAWPNGVVTTQMMGGSASPDHVFGTSTANGWPIATRKDVPWLLDGLVEELDGPHRPVVYLPYIPAGSTGNDTFTHTWQRQRGAIYGRIESPAELENIRGTEAVSEWLRGHPLVITEEG